MISKKYFKLYLAGVVGVSLIGCSSNTEPQSKPIPKTENTEVISINWSDSELSKSPSSSFVPVIEDNTLFTSDSSGTILRIDPTDGTVVTKINLKRKLSSGTAVSPDSIFVTTQDGYLISVDRANSKIKWQSQLPTVSVEAPQIGGNVILVRTNDAQILAYDVHTGNLLWVYQRPIPSLTLRAYNTFQVVGKDVALLGQPGGRIVLVNLNNGVTIWENYIAIPEGATDLDKLTDISIRPLINDKEICVASFNGKLACLDAISSNVVWSKKFSTSYGLLMDEQNLYAISQDGIVYAFDKNTGAKIWSNDDFLNRSLSTPVFMGSNLLVVDSEGYINLFSRSDGKLVSRAKSDLKNGVSYPWSNGKKAIIQSGSGTIAAITQ